MKESWADDYVHRIYTITVTRMPPLDPLVLLDMSKDAIDFEDEFSWDWDEYDSVSLACNGLLLVSLAVMTNQGALISNGVGPCLRGPTSS